MPRAKNRSWKSAVDGLWAAALLAAVLVLLGLLPASSRASSLLATDDDRARAALVTAIEGMGGLANLRSLQNWSVLSKARQFGEQGELPVTSKVTFQNNRLRQDIVMTLGHVTMIFDGKDAWQILDASKQRLPERDRLLLRRRLSRLLPRLLVEAHEGKRQVEFFRTGEHDGIPVDQIRVTDSEGFAVTLSVDRATGRVMRISYLTSTAEEDEVEEVEIRSDFRPVKGFVLPFRQVILRNGRKVREITVHDYGINEDLSPRLFDPDVTAVAGKDRGSN